MRTRSAFSVLHFPVSVLPRGKCRTGREVTCSDLETELHRHLNLPRRRAEEQARNHACARVADGVAGRGELRVIESVEELEFELVLETFAEARHLDEREVYVLLSRRAQNVAPGVAVGTRVVRGRRERAQIEPTVNRRMVELAGRDPVRAIAAAGRAQVHQLVNGEWQAGTQQQDSAPLPTADELIGQPVCPSDKPFAFAEWQFIGPTR